MSRTRRLALDTVTGYARLLVQGAVFFVLTPRMITVLGRADFGLWTLVASVVGFLGLLEGGMGITTLRTAARRAALSDDPDRRAEHDADLATLFWSHVALGVLCLGATAVLARFLDPLFALPAAQSAKAHALLWIFGARFVFLQIPLGFFRNALHGGRRIGLVGAVQAVSIVLYGAVSWAMLAGGAGIVALALWNLLNMVGEHLVYVVALPRALPGLSLRPRRFAPSRLRGLLAFSAFSFAGTVAAQILLRSDPIIVKLFLPLSAVAMYAVAMKVAENGHLLTKQVVNVMTPLAADLHASGDAPRVRRLLVDGTRFALVPALMLAVVLVPCARDLVAAWVGADMAAAGDVLALLVLSMTLAIPQLVASTVLAMSGEERFTARAAFWSCAINLVLSLLLTPWLGLVGAAVATLVTTLVIDVCMVLPRAMRHVGVGAREYVRAAVLPAAWPAAAGAALTLLLRAAWAPASIGGVLAVTLPGALLCAALFFLFGITPEEKRTLGLPPRLRLSAARRSLAARPDLVKVETCA